MHSDTTVAAGLPSGPFAAGHLGELTQQIPFEMVDAALAETRTAQRRVRDLPARVVVYLLLAGALFADLGYRQVWHRLVAGLGGAGIPSPTAGALTQARRRLGTNPMRFLFDLLRGPAAALSTRASGVYWRGLLVCVIDGTVMSVPDSPANLGRFTKHAARRGQAGYPAVRLVALVACGTRNILDAVFGPTSVGEPVYARRLVPSLRKGMLLLGDRFYGAGPLLRGVVANGAAFLIRVKIGRTGPKLPVLQRLPDGSYLSTFGGIAVRVVDAEITIATEAGKTTGIYRLMTTLLDARQHPATELVSLYHERWEIETAYLELKSSILGGRVLRARTPAGLEQEIYALLITYQILRTAMADATSSQPDIDPDRASFTVALNAARDLVIQAAGRIAGTTIDLVGHIGRVVLDNLLPNRRTRTSPRVTKRPLSKYSARAPGTKPTSYNATLTINIFSKSHSTTGPEP